MTKTNTYEVDVHHPDTDATFIVTAALPIDARLAAREMADVEIGPGAVVMSVRRITR